MEESYVGRFWQYLHARGFSNSSTSGYVGYLSVDKKGIKVSEILGEDRSSNGKFADFEQTRYSIKLMVRLLFLLNGSFL